MAKFFDAKHTIMHMDMDENRKLILTSGADRIIKVRIVAPPCF